MKQQRIQRRAPCAEEHVLTLDPHCLHAHSVRNDHYQQRMEASVREKGIRTPLTVQTSPDGGFSVIDGARRVSAAIACGMTSVPCVLMARSELPSEEDSMFVQAACLRDLIESRGWTQQIAADRLGVSQSTVANKLRLLQFSEDERTKIETAGLTERHARAVLALPRPYRADAIARIIHDGMTVASAEAMVDEMRRQIHPTRGAIRDIGIFYNSIDRALGILHNAGVDADLKREETDAGATVTIHVTR